MRASDAKQRHSSRSQSRCSQTTGQGGSLSKPPFFSIITLTTEREVNRFVCAQLVQALTQIAQAPSLGKPILVMRETTERPEAVEAGTLRLVGTNEDKIVTEAERLLDDLDAYQAMARALNPYGDVQAASRIRAALLQRTRPC